MIQRIQSVYLLLIFGLMLAMFFLPPVMKFEKEGVEVLGLSLNVIYGLSGLMALVCIFLYKNRPVQLYLCYGIALILVLSYLIILFDFGISGGSDEIKTKFQAPIIFPLFALVLDILAIRAIQSDEKLVRSTERLR
jgi:hypothetical protein